MQLEFHQLDRRWEHLRVHHPARQRRLLASLADAGQQVPIVVVAAEGQTERYVVIDGYQRIAALQQLGRDTVEAVVWPMSEAEAVLLDRSLRLSEHETRPGGGLAASGDGAAVRLQPGGAGAAVRSQCELGVAAAGLGGGVAGVDPTAGARGQDRGPGGDEVSGAGGAAKPGGLPSHGGDLGRASLRHARSRPAVCRLATGIGHGPPTDSGGSGAVFQNAAAGQTPSRAGRRTDPRSGDGPGDCEPRSAAAGRGGGTGVG